MKSVPSLLFFRPMKEEPHTGIRKSPFVKSGLEDGHGRELKPPFRPGEKCYVRETYAKLLAVSPCTDEPLEITKGERLIEPPTSWIDEKGRTRWYYDGLVIAYREDTSIEFCDGDGFMGDMADKDDMPRWMPPATMPAKYARRFVTILSCEPMRVEEVTKADMVAMGVDASPRRWWEQKFKGKEWAWRVEGEEVTR